MHDRFILAVALFALTGCSSSGNDQTVDAAPEAAPSVCVTDPRVRPFSIGLTAKTPSGLTVTVDAADPTPPAKGDNAWSVTLTDAGGAPVDGATIEVKPFMPDHGHGSSIKPAVMPSGGGKYAVTRLNLFMPGVWEITFTVTRDGKSEDAVFTLCIST